MKTTNHFIWWTFSLLHSTCLQAWLRQFVILPRRGKGLVQLQTSNLSYVGFSNHIKLDKIRRRFQMSNFSCVYSVKPRSAKKKGFVTSEYILNWNSEQLNFVPVYLDEAYLDSINDKFRRLKPHPHFSRCYTRVLKGESRSPFPQRCLLRNPINKIS